MTTVLVIDDSEADQFITKSVIKDMHPDINVIQAFDGEEGLDIIDKLKEEPDLILLDINMPILNGHEFLREFSVRNYKGIVVVMLTSSLQIIDVERTKKYPFVKAYYDKPLSEIDVNFTLELIEK